MEFVHLSDLHLGKRVNEFSMLEDQQHILTEILHIIDTEKPDGVLIAGDVYDKSVPSAEAVALLDNFLVCLSQRSLPGLRGCLGQRTAVHQRCGLQGGRSAGPQTAKGPVG